MMISQQDGIISFDNLILKKRLSETVFRTSYEEFIIPRVFNGEWHNYSFLNAANSNGVNFALLVLFHNGVIHRISITIDHAGTTFEDETPASLQEDGVQLHNIVKEQLGYSSDNIYQYYWGKIEIVQDFKNSFKTSVVISYSE